MDLVRVNGVFMYIIQEMTFKMGVGIITILLVKERERFR